MRALVQRVSRASVKVDGEIISAIQTGMLILLGIETNDTEADIPWLVQKLNALRIFPDAVGVMNLDIRQAGGDFLVVSQFTLHASTKKGNRPSYIRSAKPEQAEPLYEEFIRQLATASGNKVQTGSFGAAMNVELVNDGPVTILIDTQNKE